MIKKNIIGLDNFAIITFIENNLYEFSYHFPDFKTSFILDQASSEHCILQYPGDTEVLNEIVNKIIRRTLKRIKYD